MRAQVRKAFTLVEILIVVVILGILAAIVVPQFTNATQDAMAGNIQTQLDTLNNQLELYKARNNGNLPADFSTGGATNPTATPPVHGPWATLISEGYIKSVPENPACPSRTAGGDPGAVVIGAPAEKKGWNYQNGTLEACYFDEITHKVTQTP